MTGIQKIALDSICRSAVSIQLDFNTPWQDCVKRCSDRYIEKNKKQVRQRNNACHKRMRGKLAINPKWHRCYGGGAD